MRIILYILTGIAIYIVLNVELGLLWSIPVNFNPDKINRALLNLSYSYLAGYIFYLVVTWLPFCTRKRKFREIISSKYGMIKTQIESNIQAFDTTENYHLEIISLDELQTLVSKKNITDLSFYAEQTLIKQSIIQLLGASKTETLKLCHSILVDYKEYLSVNEVVLLEEIIAADYFKIIDSPPYWITQTPKYIEQSGIQNTGVVTSLKEAYKQYQEELAKELYEVIKLVRKLN